MITLDDVRDAARQLEGVAHRTPVITSTTLNDRCGAQIYLKAENLQRIGAFKFRGAYNVISRLSEAELGRGVAAWSSGNHAQAVSLAARMMGATATIVMPEDAPPSKIAATRGYGANVVFYDRYTGDREAIGREFAEEKGMTLVPPYEHDSIMAGHRRPRTPRRGRQTRRAAGAGRWGRPHGRERDRREGAVPWHPDGGGRT